MIGYPDDLFDAEPRGPSIEDLGKRDTKSSVISYKGKGKFSERADKSA